MKAPTSFGEVKGRSLNLWEQALFRADEPGSAGRSDRSGGRSVVQARDGIGMVNVLARRDPARPVTASLGFLLASREEEGGAKSDQGRLDDQAGFKPPGVDPGECDHLMPKVLSEDRTQSEDKKCQS